MNSINDKSSDRLTLRGLVIACLVTKGVNQTKQISEETGFSRLQVNRSIASVSKFGLIIKWEGTNRSGQYVIRSWGYFSKETVEQDYTQILHRTLSIEQ
ncbi:hypothetical protein A1QO_04235 [Vibrio genomosp. F10 str. ZF-129]|uniref:MarR family transcriptional regulator n=2 Tax=Vibrio genomosp. F10 TaxID=723171 RepID=A0A1E5BIR2_9VIBR|nr:hypothetical protein A1QO_04235 [Vibrio genomosp. F10 str. ZF-129]